VRGGPRRSRGVPGVGFGRKSRENRAENIRPDCLQVPRSVLDVAGRIISNDTKLVARVVQLSSDNAVLVLLGQPLKVNDTWPMTQYVQPKVLNQTIGYKLVGHTVGWQSAVAGRVAVVYEVRDTDGNLLVENATLAVTLPYNRQPFVGDGGNALFFDGRDDYVGNVDFKLPHLTWTNDSSIFGKANKGGTYGGQNGLGHSSSVTVEMWLHQTTEYLQIKEFIRGTSIGGQSLFTIGNSDTNATTASSCPFEQPDFYCYGRFQGHIPWTGSWPYAYFDYGWMNHGDLGRVHFPCEPYIDSWIHLAFVVDIEGARQSVYANGQEVISGVPDGPVADLTGVILGGMPALNSFHRGDVDEFRVYKRAKTDVEIRDGMFRRADVADPGLLGYWTFDDCGADGEVSINCQDLSKFNRPLIAAVCGQAYSSKVTPGWGHQPGVVKYDDDDLIQHLRNCKRFAAPAASDKDSRPQGVRSRAPVASGTTPLGPQTPEEEASGIFTGEIAALDPDSADILQLEVVQINAPGVIITSTNVTLSAGTVIPMTRDSDRYDSKHTDYPIVHRVELVVTVPQQRDRNIGALVVRVRDQHGTRSSSANVQINGFLCEPGKEYNTLGLGSSTCLPCNAGFYSTGVGGPCVPCPAGSYSAAPGGTKCELSPLGHMVQDRGTSVPVRCPPGFIASGKGSVQCEPCAQGSYQPNPGQSACTPCSMRDSMTLSFGATSPSACVCGAGAFAPLSMDRCVPCPVGLECGVGSSLSSIATSPVVLPGHYIKFSNASDGASISVYMCKPALACPGGRLEEKQRCSGRRFGFLCAECPDGTYAAHGSCEECDGLSYFGIVLVVLLLLAMLLSFTIIGARMHPAVANPNGAMLLKVLGLALMFFQTLGAIHNIGIVWADPFKSVLKVMTLVNFDIDVIHINCTRAGGPLSLYILKMVLPAAGILFMFTVWFVLSLLKRAVRFDGLLNVVGHVLTVFYIMQTVAAFSPYSCYNHPNGASSMTTAPQVLCDDDKDHSDIVGVSVFGIIAYPVTIFAVTVFATWRYTAMVVRSDLRFVTRFGFIFHRWTPERYWFGIVALARNFLVSVLPTLIPDSEYVLAILLVEFVLLATVCLLLTYQPWRVSLLTFCDTVLNVSLLVVLCIGSAATDASMAASAVCTIIFALGTFGCFVIVCSSISRAVRGPTYTAFLSHHKKDGACRARLLKMHLQVSSVHNIFLDCDDLAFLGDLFDAVKKSKVVLVLLTGKTLDRPWCLGEIGQAFLSKIPLLPVVFFGAKDSIDVGNDAIPKSCVEIEDLEGVRMLLGFGISFEAVSQGLSALLSQPFHNVCLKTTASFQNSVSTLYDQLPLPRTLYRSLNKFCSCTQLGKARLQQASATSGIVWAICDGKDPEALAAVRVIKFYVQLMVQMETVLDADHSVDKFLDIAKKRPASGGGLCVLLMLTSGSMRSAMQMARCELLHRYQQAHFVPVVVDDSYDFPSKSFYNTYHTGEGPFGQNAAVVLSDAAGEGVTPGDVVEILKHVFSTIAIVVNISKASETMLKQSMKSVVNRILSTTSRKGAQKITIDDDDSNRSI